MGGFAGGLARGIGRELEQHREENRADDTAARDRQADVLEKSIQGIQANMGQLDPNSDEYKKSAQALGEAQKQMQGLFKPHEGPHLLKRMGKLFGIGQPKAMDEKIPGVGGTPAAPGSPTIKPGMTITDILGAAAPHNAPQMKPLFSQPQVAQDGKAYMWYGTPDGSTIVKREIPGYEAPQDEEGGKPTLWLMDASGNPVPATIKNGKAVPIQLPEGMRAQDPSKPQTGKEPRVEVKDGAVIVTDPMTNKTYTTSNIKDAPKEIQTLYKDTAEGVKKTADEKESREDRRFQQSLSRQEAALQNALKRSDYVSAKRTVEKAKDDYRNAVDRSKTMDLNLAAALGGDQQAMLSLVANHIGMTLGAQKGARITRAVWDEATASTPWMQKLEAKFDSRGYLSGVTLAPEQMRSMVGLAHEKVKILKEHVDGVEQDYADDLGTKKDATATKGPASKMKEKATKGSAKKVIKVSPEDMK